MAEPRTVRTRLLAGVALGFALAGGAAWWSMPSRTTAEESAISDACTTMRLHLTAWAGEAWMKDTAAALKGQLTTEEVVALCHALEPLPREAALAALHERLGVPIPPLPPPQAPTPAGDHEQGPVGSPD